MEKNTLKNIFHMYWFYIVRFQDGAEQRISRNKLIYENHILSYDENFRDCLVEFYELRDNESLHSFYQFIVDAVNSLNKQERILIYERYLHKNHYKSNRKHYMELDMKPHQYDKLLQSASGKIVARLEKNVFANNSDLLGQ